MKTTTKTAHIQGTVPNGAAGNYKAKELLKIDAIVINSGKVTGAVSASGVHINAYFGDVSGDGIIDGSDTLAANSVAAGAASGFGAFPLLDPAVVGDIAIDYSVDGGDVSAIDSFVALLAPAQIPVPPHLTITANGAAPALSVASTPSAVGGTRSAPTAMGGASAAVQPVHSVIVNGSAIGIDAPGRQNSQVLNANLQPLVKAGGDTPVEVKNVGKKPALIGQKIQNAKGLLKASHLHPAVQRRLASHIALLDMVFAQLANQMDDS